MSHAADLPLWAALLASFLVLLGASLALVGAIGLVRLKTFYDRLHAPSLGATWGAGGVLLGSMLLFSVLQSRLVVHEVLIAVFVTVTTPVTLMLLGRAALYRDRSENTTVSPPSIRNDDETRSGDSI
jgi:multicomponent K+:H+ antiporter subunit G